MCQKTWSIQILGTSFCCCWKGYALQTGINRWHFDLVTYLQPFFLQLMVNWLNNKMFADLKSKQTFLCSVFWQRYTGYDKHFPPHALGYKPFYYLVHKLPPASHSPGLFLLGNPGSIGSVCCRIRNEQNNNMSREDIFQSVFQPVFPKAFEEWGTDLLICIFDIQFPHMICILLAPVPPWALLLFGLHLLPSIFGFFPWLSSCSASQETKLQKSILEIQTFLRTAHWKEWDQIDARLWFSQCVAAAWEGGIFDHILVLYQNKCSLYLRRLQQDEYQKSIIYFLPSLPAFLLFFPPFKVPLELQSTKSYCKISHCENLQSQRGDGNN